MQALKAEIHILVETCGLLISGSSKVNISYADIIYFDIKIMDPTLRKHTVALAMK